MFYNNRSYRLANFPQMRLNVSNSETPADFAANVYRVLQSTGNPSIVNAIDTMANQNATYKGIVIRNIPELKELYNRIVNTNGQISENDIATELDSIFAESAQRGAKFQTNAPRGNNNPNLLPGRNYLPGAHPPQSTNYLPGNNPPQSTNYLPGNNPPQLPGQQSQYQSVSQMYNVDPMLSNFKRTMDLQMQSFNTTKEDSFKQQFKATFGMYSQYIRERQISDRDYETYKKVYDNLSQKGSELQQNVENTRSQLGV